MVWDSVTRSGFDNEDNEDNADNEDNDDNENNELFAYLYYE